MKRVVVSQKVDHVLQRNEIRDALDQRLVNFLLYAGISPVPMPNSLSENLSQWLETVQPEGVVLSGGNDIGKVRCRDDTELHLLQYAEKHELPVLGICRGMQFLAVREGVALIEVEGHVATFHQIYGEYGERKVNSYHRYALNDCPDGYEVIACCIDGVIEGIRHFELPWEGWMWHPEREGKFADIDLKNVKRLFK